jgi:hypothetical protein
MNPQAPDRIPVPKGISDRADRATAEAETLDSSIIALTAQVTSVSCHLWSCFNAFQTDSAQFAQPPPTISDGVFRMPE